MTMQSCVIFFVGALIAAHACADFTGKVVAVTDGDTIKVLDSTNTQYKVRLTGIDAPERGQPFGTASKDNLAQMVAGKEVFVESDKKDRYGRVLGKVWVQPYDCPTCGKTLDKGFSIGLFISVLIILLRLAHRRYLDYSQDLGQINL